MGSGVGVSVTVGGSVSIGAWVAVGGGLVGGGGMVGVEVIVGEGGVLVGGRVQVGMSTGGVGLGGVAVTKKGVKDGTNAVAAAAVCVAG